MSVTSFRASHPRRAQVNDRLNNQNARISAGVANGTLSTSQAHALRQQDHFIRAEERNMASANGSHITPAQRKALNQQLNANSQDIFSQKSAGAAAQAAAAAPPPPAPVPVASMTFGSMGGNPTTAGGGGPGTAAGATSAASGAE